MRGYTSCDRCGLEVDREDGWRVTMACAWCAAEEFYWVICVRCFGEGADNRHKLVCDDCRQGED